MGYRTRVGGLWSGEYLVMPFSSSKNTTSHQSLQLRKVRTVEFPSKVTFPLASGHVKFNELPDGYSQLETPDGEEEVPEDPLHQHTLDMDKVPQPLHETT